MFEAAELGRRVSKDVYKDEERKLQTDLLVTQRAMRDANVPVLIIVAGVEGAGKGDVVNLLHTWLDTRGLEIHAFFDETDEERERPDHWRFWRRLPARGRIGVMFGSWYSQPVIDRAYERIDEEAFDNRMRHVSVLERLLNDDGYLIVKLWFHLPKKVQKRRAKEQKKQNESLLLSPYVYEFSKNYKRFAAVAQRAIRLTDAGFAPWQLIEATDWRYRNLATGQVILKAMQYHLQINGNRPPAVVDDRPIIQIPGATETILDHVDLSQELSGKDYKSQLEQGQRKLNALTWKAWKKKRSLVAVFEGWDAAGKGGVIRRATAAIDARLLQVIPTAAPTDEEKAHHYLWRFWRLLPRDGKLTFFDRSWYGRVLVERVEGFAGWEEWMRAYREINEFEEQLVEHGAILAKFWLHISKDEQLRRFKAREETPWKEYKITPDDWRNREKWDDYRAALNEMVTRTGTEYAPWHLVPTEDKHFGRVFVINTLCQMLEAELS